MVTSALARLASDSGLAGRGRQGGRRPGRRPERRRPRAFGSTVARTAGDLPTRRTAGVAGEGDPGPPSQRSDLHSLPAVSLPPSRGLRRRSAVSEDRPPLPACSLSPAAQGIEAAVRRLRGPTSTPGLQCLSCRTVLHLSCRSPAPSVHRRLLRPHRPSTRSGVLLAGLATPHLRGRHLHRDDLIMSRFSPSRPYQSVPTWAGAAGGRSANFTASSSSPSHKYSDLQVR